MKTTILILIAMLAFFRLSAQETTIHDSDIKAIEDVIQVAYVEGLQNEGDTVKINSGFHPGFELLIPGKNGELKKLSITEWKAKVRADLASGKLPRKEEEKVSVRFLNVDVSGNAAMAKFEFYVGKNLTFIDYQFIYKFGEQWKIVSKIFFRI